MWTNVKMADAGAVVPAFQVLRSVGSRIDKLYWYREVFEKNGWSYAMAAFETRMMRLKWIKNRLDNNSLVEPPHDVLVAYRRLGRSRNEIVEIFGRTLDKKVRPDDGVQKYLEEVKEIGNLARQSELNAQILLEIYEKERHGWHIVMNTLTCRNENIKLVFYEGAKEWRKYINKITMQVGVAVYGSKKKYLNSDALTNDLHTYVAVVERGESTGRLHIHCLHFIKRLPKKASDPNLRSFDGTKREIACFKAYWQHGFSVPVAVRFNGNDSFAKIGWKWPLMKVGDALQPIKPGSPGQLAGYLAKYLAKSYSIEKGIKWRTKKSKNFGRKILMIAVRAMKTETLSNYLIGIENTKNLPKMGRMLIPSQSLRRIALKELLKRQRRSLKIEESDLKLREIPQGEPLLEQAKTRMIRSMTELYKRQKITSLSTMTYSKEDISDARECIQMVFTEAGIGLHRYTGSSSSSFN